MDESMRIQTILLDMDGVLWRGAEPLIDIPYLFQSIRDLGCQVFCVTNNSTKSVDMYRKTLQDFGVTIENDQIITSAVGTAEYLASEFSSGCSLYVIGEKGLEQTILEYGFKLVEAGSRQDVEAVVIGLDRNLTYRKLEEAVDYLRRGAKFVGTNPDRTIPTPEGPAPGAGAVIAAVEASTSLTPKIIGKPAEYLFKLALDRSGSLPEETLMIGDRLETDIQGAQNQGIRTCLVLTGIASSEDAAAWNPQPDRTAGNVLDLVKELISNEKKLI